MSGKLDEAVGAVMGMLFGGIFILIMASELNSISMINFTAIGFIYIFGAIIAATLLVYGAFASLVR